MFTTWKYIKNLVHSMAISDNNYLSSLSIEDWLSISKIIVGCTKLVYESYQYVGASYNRLRGLAKTSRKEIALLSSFVNITRRTEGRPIFRPSNLRQKLPENIQKIQPSDLTDVLKILEKYQVIAKSDKDMGKRGRPPRKSMRLPGEPGPKSYYQSTEYLYTVKKVLDKPEARKIVFFILKEANILSRYWKIKALSYLYSLRFGGKDKRIEIDKAVGQPTDEKNLEKIYSKIRGLDHKELEAMAEEIGRSMTKRIKEDDGDLRNFYLWGINYFYA